MGMGVDMKSAWALSGLGRRVDGSTISSKTIIKSRNLEMGRKKYKLPVKIQIIVTP